MSNQSSNRTKVRILLVAAIVGLTALAVYAADMDFSGKWKGESKPAAAPAAGATVPGAPPAPGGGGGRGGFGGGGRGGGGFGGPQKATLNLKHNVKDGKISGNIVIGETVYDVKEGKVEGNKITFKAVMTAQPTVEYTAVMLKEGELTLTSRPTDGRGRVTEYILKK
jgi:hypothetical protein